MWRENLKQKQHTPIPVCVPFLLVLGNVAVSFRKRPKSSVDSACENKSPSPFSPHVLCIFWDFIPTRGSNITPQNHYKVQHIEHRADGQYQRHSRTPYCKDNVILPPMKHLVTFYTQQINIYLDKQRARCDPTGFTEENSCSLGR